MNGLCAAAPADLDALKAMLASAAGPLCYVAGGTDMLVSPREPPHDGWLVDISRTRGLGDISLSAGTLRIGATATLTHLIRSDLVRQHLPALAQAADLCGSVQIRNRATVGGNAANASPAGDLLPVLKCLDAAFQIVHRDGGGESLAFDSLLIGAGRTSLTPGSLITRIDIPLGPRLGRCAFVKLGRRDDLTISRLNLIMEADFDTVAGRFGTVHLVAGAIAPVPLRLDAVADELAGKYIVQETVRRFLEALIDAVDGAIPNRASHGYKRRAIMGLGLDLLAQITGREMPLP